MAYPTNVLHLATECNNKNHSAAFPLELPSWFIKLFTKENDTVMDPFMGSGTTLFAAKNLKRNSIGIEIIADYYNTVKKTIGDEEYYLFENEVEYASVVNK
jgi:site-specific DNA-methyltransferase (adenine-specific)/site-specific DNA-methyltransferase (cytosine-N4-specific)